MAEGQLRKHWVQVHESFGVIAMQCLSKPEVSVLSQAQPDHLLTFDNLMKVEVHQAIT